MMGRSWVESRERERVRPRARQRVAEWAEARAPARDELRARGWALAKAAVLAHLTAWERVDTKARGKGEAKVLLTVCVMA